MPSFKKILVATDFSASSGAAFQVALNLCNELGANLSVLHVFEYADVVPPEAGGQLLELENTYEKAQHFLNDLLKRAKQVGVTCETFIESGVAPLTILEKAASKNIDLVILGTNAIHGFERLVFGSTAEEVLRKAPCPVLTVGPRVLDAAVKIEGPVIFATDFNLETIHAIRYAASFGQMTGSSLHCLHVLPRMLESGVQSHVIPQIMTEALEHVATESGTTIKPSICVTTYGSEISNAIVDYARKERAKLIVLGVRQASMVASHVPAHIAYHIITEAPCPVMTVAFPSHSHAIRAAACL